MTLIRFSKKQVMIHLLLGVIFMAFALLQLNDPDPAIWFAIYAMIALICFAVSFVKLNNLLIYIYVLLLIVYAGFHFSYLIDWLQTNNKEEILGNMVYEKPYLEGSREFIGLAMGICGLLLVAKTNRK